MTRVDPQWAVMALTAPSVSRQRPRGAKIVVGLLVLLLSGVWISSPARANSESNSSLFLPGEIDRELAADAARQARQADTELSLARASIALTRGTGLLLPPPGLGAEAAELRYREARQRWDEALLALAQVVSRPEGVEALVEEWRLLSRSQRSIFFDAIDRAGYSYAARAVSLEGCPDEVPEGTLRGGAAEIGAGELCRAAVMSAPTAEAAIAIKYTFAQLGARYSVERRNQVGFYDCSSLVMRAYASSGVPGVVRGGSFTTRTIAPYPGYRSVPWLSDVAWEDRQAGDLLLTPPNRADGGGHVMMVLAYGYVIHAATEGDVVHIRTEYPRSDIDYVRRVVVFPDFPSSPQSAMRPQR